MSFVVENFNARHSFLYELNKNVRYNHYIIDIKTVDYYSVLWII